MLSRVLLRIRRRLLSHRRVLAALLTGLAVLAALRALSPGAPASVELTVAARDLPAGVTLGAGDLTTVSVPASLVPDGATAEPAGETLAAPLRRGEPVTDARLVGAALAAEPGQVAVPVRLPDAEMAALLDPGDRIDLLAVDPSANGPAGAAQVATGVLVLAVPDSAHSETAVTSGLQGRLVIIGVAEELVDDVTNAAVRSFLTFAFAR
ncbi:SAF domain-containing protein [Nocardioides sp.]|uniref:SAF domain-containing protein n=1 Tax=Nocardioides sp. TaxID=35761 RepID=UPI0039E5292C